MTVQIITDSGSDLTPELMKGYDIQVAPLQVLMQGKDYKDGVTLSAKDFYEQMRADKELPRTSQPTPHDFQVAYESAAVRGPVLGIHTSSALSGTYEGARSTAAGIGGDITIFDSLTSSGGLLLLVLGAARMAKEGASVQQIVAYLEEARKVSHTLVALQTLENAIKGGRVTPLAGFAANLLSIKPIVHVSPEGRVIPIDKVRGRVRALDRLLDIAAERRTDWKGRRAVVGHGGCPEEAEAFATRVKERFGIQDVIVGYIGCGVGTYSAGDAILLSF